jgi:hypothetical protein
MNSFHILITIFNNCKLIPLKTLKKYLQTILVKNKIVSYS